MAHPHPHPHTHPHYMHSCPAGCLCTNASARWKRLVQSWIVMSRQPCRVTCNLPPRRARKKARQRKPSSVICLWSRRLAEALILLCLMRGFCFSLVLTGIVHVSLFKGPCSCGHSSLLCPEQKWQVFQSREAPFKKRPERCLRMQKHRFSTNENQFGGLYFPWGILIKARRRVRTVTLSWQSSGVWNRIKKSSVAKLAF